MSVKIKKFSITNYRSCQRTTFSPHQNLSTLIGANGSGKTSVLNAILLLKKIWSIERYRERYDSKKCLINVEFETGKEAVKYKANINYLTDDRNEDEVFGITEKWNFGKSYLRDEWIDFPIPLALMMQRNEYFFSRNESRKYLSKSYLGKKFINPEIFKKIFPVFEKISNFILTTKYYGATQFTNPSECPTWLEMENLSSPGRSRLNAREHGKFMHDLYLTYKKDNKKFNEYLSLVGSEGLGLIDSIEYKEYDAPSSAYEVRTGGKLIKKETKKQIIIPGVLIKKYSLSPNQLSEGTFKTLALLFYLITDKSQFMLIEEPEVCVHHGLLLSIIELIKTFSKNKQIIISTHSDFVLDRLSPDNVFVVKNDFKNGSNIKHIPRAMSKNRFDALKEYLTNVGNLGEYWRQGALESE